jgi:hypothetical protein
MSASGSTETAALAKKHNMAVAKEAGRNKVEQIETRGRGYAVCYGREEAERLKNLI